MPRRMSVWPVAIHTRTPDAMGIIAAVHRSPTEAASLTGIPSRKIHRWLRGHVIGETIYPALWTSNLARKIGARIGVLSVLHTWGSALTHHPHVHMIAPGGGISLDRERWVACRPNFFLPVRVLSRLFRGLVLERLDAAHRAGQLQFFGKHVALTNAQAFAAYLAPLTDYNDARPHSQLGWKTPSEFAFTCRPRRDLALRYAEGSAPAPVATAAQPGKSNSQGELTIG
jgi:hypothetical protein